MFCAVGTRVCVCVLGGPVASSVRASSLRVHQQVGAAGAGLHADALVHRGRRAGAQLVCDVSTVLFLFLSLVATHICM